MIVWSSGGGVQSTAIAALICLGQLPRPDLSIIADTGREKGSTWDYLDRWVAPALADIGVSVHRIPHDYATIDMYSHSGRLLIPAFTNASGSQGKLDTYCSNEWRVCQRFVRERLPGQAVDVWLGFSTDEIHRCKASSQDWWRHVFPLIELCRMSRADCEALVNSMGWPAPPRSSCWMCPLMSDQEWKGLPESERTLAAALEAKIQETDPHAWLHRSMMPVAEAAFEDQGDLFEAGCRSGYCFT